MAFMALLHQDIFRLSLGIGLIGVLSSLFLYLFYKPPFPKNAPPLTAEPWPVIGALRFFTQRWDFYQRAMMRSNTGNFSFYAGQWPVVAVSTDEGRKLFFESKKLGFTEAYAALLGGSPAVKENNNPFAEDHNEGSGFEAYFNKRVVNLLKGNRIANSLPQLLKDVRVMLDDLAKHPNQTTDPFHSIYRMVFQFTIRAVACNEIAEDTALLDRVLRLFEDIGRTATPTSIMYPWMPVPAKFKRYYSGAQLYIIFKRVVDERKKHGRRENDALQYLLDEGDNITDIISFVLGALFAGQLNTGVNAAWVLVYLAGKPEWLARVRDEIKSVADRHAPDTTQTLRERLMQVPAAAWESEFSLIDMCLRDSIRLQFSGTLFRKNMSNSDIVIDKSGEVIPKGSFVTLAAGLTNYNPDIFPNPTDWDPGRYMPDRAEDEKIMYGSWVWGAGRHPCLGMRFAKLEVNIIVAFFLAYFDDVRLCDEGGNPTSRFPAINRNMHAAERPKERVYIKYKAAK